jgi:HlyD family secretion protein
LTADQVTNFKVKVRILKESYKDLVVGKPASYSPFRPGMTATVDIITTTKTNVVKVPISSVVVKSDTTAVKIGQAEGSESDDKKPAPKSDKKLECVFVKVGDKAKIKIIKTGIQDDTNIEVLSGLKKGEVVITGPYTTVSKDLNSGDKVFVSSEGDKKK